MAVSPYSSGIWVTWTPSGKYGEPADQALQAVAHHLRADLAEQGAPVNTSGKGVSVSLTLQTLAEPDRTVSGVLGIVPRRGLSDSALAAHITNAVHEATGLPDRGVQQRNFYVRPGSISIVLILCNRNNPQDLSALLENPALFAQAIASALASYPEQAQPDSEQPEEISPEPPSAPAPEPEPEPEPELMPPEEVPAPEPGQSPPEQPSEQPPFSGMAPQPEGPGAGQPPRPERFPAARPPFVQMRIPPVFPASSVPPAYRPVVNPVVKSSARAIPVMAQSESELAYQKFLRENPRQGFLKVMAYRGNQAYPVPQADVVISKRFGDEERIFFEGKTDINGIIDHIDLPAPIRDTSFNPASPPKSAVYTLTASHPEFQTIQRDINVFENTRTIQMLEYQLAKEENA